MHYSALPIEIHSFIRENACGEGSLIHLSDSIQSSPGVNSLGFPVRLIQSQTRIFFVLTGSTLVIDYWPPFNVKTLSISARQQIFLGCDPLKEKSYCPPLCFKVDEQFSIGAPHLIVGKNVEFAEMPEQHLIVLANKITLYTSKHRSFFEKWCPHACLEVIEEWAESEK